MATVKIPITVVNGKPLIPVTITHGDKKVTLNMIVDTGWQDNHLEAKYARLLGYTSADILAKLPNENKYQATVKVGGLKPIETFLNIANPTSGVMLNVFGALWMRQYDNFIITRSGVTATDMVLLGVVL